jgi:hypothetical protein
MAKVTVIKGGTVPKETTCKGGCNRAVLSTDVDEQGRCCHCAPAAPTTEPAK